VLEPIAEAANYREIASYRMFSLRDINDEYDNDSKQERPDDKYED